MVSGVSSPEYDNVLDKRHFYFCGMIGSGKTTLGVRLANELKLDFYDLDQEMNKILGYSLHKFNYQFL